MNLGNAKKRTLMILDEYTANGSPTVDKDLDLRMNDFFDMAQIAVSRIKPIVKYYEVPAERLGNGELVKYPMPDDFDRLIDLWADLKPISRGVWMGKSLILPDNEDRQIIAVYAAFPTPITEATPDSFEFELASDAQQCLPYYVAGSHLFVDFVVDNSKIMQRYQELLATLSPAIEQSEIRVVQMETEKPLWF